MALTEKQQKVQVCENDWVRIIVGVQRADKRRMDELRSGGWSEGKFKEEIGQE